MKIICYLLKLNIKKDKTSHLTYNERHEKIIELIDWALEKYKETATNIKMNQQNEEAIIIETIIEKLDKKRDIAINQNKKALLKDEVAIYRLEEILLIIFFS